MKFRRRFRSTHGQLIELNFIVAPLNPFKITGRETGSKTAARWLSLTPFGAALALSIMRLQRFQQPVTNLFVAMTSEAADHAARIRASSWLSTAQVGSKYTRIETSNLNFIRTFALPLFSVSSTHAR